MKTTSALIQEYKKLFDEGTLTAEEYNYLKNYLLSQGDTAYYEEEENILEASLKKVKEKEKAEKSRKLSHIGALITTIAIIIILVVLLIFGIKSCTDFLFDDDSSNYETYYEDDNGNGELDQGEWNYTVDEDGGIVDIDDDLSNFE